MHIRNPRFWLALIGLLLFFLYFPSQAPLGRRLTSPTTEPCCTPSSGKVSDTCSGRAFPVNLLKEVLGNVRHPAGISFLSVTIRLLM